MLPTKRVRTGSIGGHGAPKNGWLPSSSCESKPESFSMHTHPDFEDLLRLLEANRVEYMIVGGYAVAYHGFPRFTKDLDGKSGTGPGCCTDDCPALRPCGTLADMTTLPSHAASPDAADDLLFREQCRRQLRRPLEARMKYGFCRVARPGLNAPAARVFESTRAYREWCAATLPAYLGYQPAPPE
jgi:hypothetical protein